jgi:hypothetical protein
MSSIYVVEKGSRGIFELYSLPDCLVVRPVVGPGVERPPAARLEIKDLDENFNAFLARFLIPDQLPEIERRLSRDSNP